MSRSSQLVRAGECKGQNRPPQVSTMRCKGRGVPTGLYSSSSSSSTSASGLGSAYLLQDSGCLLLLRRRPLLLDWGLLLLLRRRPLLQDWGILLLLQHHGQAKAQADSQATARGCATTTRKRSTTTTTTRPRMMMRTQRTGT